MVEISTGLSAQKRTLPRRTLLLGLASAIATPSVLAATSLSLPAATAIERNTPLLIKYGQDVPSAAQLRQNASLASSLPFDGYVVHFPRVSGQTFSGIQLADTDLQSGADIPAMGKATHNFARIVLADGTEIRWTDDALWENIADNLRRLAGALKSSGRKWDGIFLDLEWYGNPTPSPFNYGVTTKAWTSSEVGGALPGMSVRDACALVQARGSTIMKAAISGWKEVKIITTFGPWISDPQTARKFTAIGITWNDVAWANELVAPLTVGMSKAAMNASASWIDGAEIYSTSTSAELRAVADWVRKGWALQDTRVLTDSDRSAYVAHSSVALPAYDRSGPSYSLRSAQQLGSLVTNALTETDLYAWLYTEAHDWVRSGSGKPTVPSSYVTAVANARADARNR